MNILARILSHGFAIVVVLLLASANVLACDSDLLDQDFRKLT